MKETLGHYPNGGPAALARFDRVLTECKTVSITTNGQTVFGTISAISFPTIGDESHAYQLKLTYKGFTLGLEVVVARRGDTDMSIVYEDVSNSDLTQLRDFAANAIGKIA
jgi:hypothetical protein